MPLTIPDEVLRDLHMSEQEARIDLACRLFDADKLSKSAACRWTQLSRAEFEGELTKRGLAWIRLGGDEYLAPERGWLNQLRAKAPTSNKPLAARD